MLYHKKRTIDRKKKNVPRPQYDALGQLTPEEKVRILIHKNPASRAVLRACLFMSIKHDGRFAGAWVMQILRVDGVTPPSNLRTLSAIGLLNRENTTRSGNRAYYTMPHAKAVAKALKTSRD